MLKIERQRQRFSILGNSTLAEASITERSDLQEYIANSPVDFFREFGLDLFLIGKEVEASGDLQDRIDLLALDKEGSCVIVELKRGAHKLQMLQAISYAAMISKWESDEILNLIEDDQKESLRDFLEVDLDFINRRQRIVLIAEAYDYALLLGAEWLSENYGLDISCCRITMAKDAATDSEYLICSNVHPSPELVKEAVSRGRKKRSNDAGKWTDWNSALDGIPNKDLTNYFKQEIENNQESYLPKRELKYRLAGKRRWVLSARNKNAYAWQQGRFHNDIKFWEDGLSKNAGVKPVKEGLRLRFFLEDENDFKFFNHAVTQLLRSTEWD
ncbi:hypothetical protein OAG10_06210 [Verrucomicrobia bacterium]|nr:hypothetical protein [Verrucomicrobiota bacterium]